MANRDVKGHVTRCLDVWLVSNVGDDQNINETMDNIIMKGCNVDGRDD